MFKTRSMTGYVLICCNVFVVAEVVVVVAITMINYFMDTVFHFSFKVIAVVTLLSAHPGEVLKCFVTLHCIIL